MYRWFVLETNFNVDNRAIFNTLVWDFISHFLSLFLCVSSVHQRWGFTGQLPCRYLRTLVIFLCWHNHLWKPSKNVVVSQSVSWISQVTTGYASYYTLFYYSSVCPAISHRNVVVSLYLVGPIKCFDEKMVYWFIYLHLTYLYNYSARLYGYIWVTKYMLQLCNLSNRNSVTIISVFMGLNSTVQ